MIPVGAPEVLAAVITEPEVTMTGEGSGLFFMSPSRRGHHQATTAAATDPTLVMGLDFLFWYGYGNRDK